MFFLLSFGVFLWLLSRWLPTWENRPNEMWDHSPQFWQVWVSQKWNNSLHWVLGNFLPNPISLLLERTATPKILHLLPKGWIQLQEVEFRLQLPFSQRYEIRNGCLSLEIAYETLTVFRCRRKNLPGRRQRNPQVWERVDVRSLDWVQG